MENTLGLNEHHQGIITNYLKFTKYQRHQYLKTVKRSFENVKSSRLLDETLTIDEVNDLLDDLCSVLMGDLESDLINMAHTAVLLLCQMCSQAEQWYLKLKADTSELENREMLNRIDKFDKNMNSSFDKSSPVSPVKMTKLEPLADTAGSSKLLSMEIERLEIENKKLFGKLKAAETKTINIIEEKSNLSEELTEKKSELSMLKDLQVEDMHETLENLRKTKEEMKVAMHDQGAQREKLQKSLAEATQRLLEAKAQCQLTTKELEQKFGETTTYKNMKQMLAAKNDQIKALRKKLKQYEPEDSD